MSTVANRFAVELGDDVPGFDSRLLGRTTRRDISYQRPRVVLQVELLSQGWVHILDVDAHETAHHPALLDEAFHYRAREVDWNCKTDAVIATAATENRSVDADQASFGIDQRATGIARVDRRVSLDEILIIQTNVPAAGRADN